jgi:hypothetical protein
MCERKRRMAAARRMCALTAHRSSPVRHTPELVPRGRLPRGPAARSPRRRGGRRDVTERKARGSQQLSAPMYSASMFAPRLGRAAPRRGLAAVRRHLQVGCSRRRYWMCGRQLEDRVPGSERFSSGSPGVLHDRTAANRFDRCDDSVHDVDVRQALGRDCRRALGRGGKHLARYRLAGGASRVRTIGLEAPT